MTGEQTRRLLRIEGVRDLVGENDIRRHVLAIEGIRELELDPASGWVDVAGERRAVERAVDAIRDLGYTVR
jgi:hypothetical protein